MPARQRVAGKSFEVFRGKNPAARNGKSVTNETPKTRGFTAESAQIIASTTVCGIERPQDRFVTHRFDAPGSSLIARRIDHVHALPWFRVFGRWRADLAGSLVRDVR